METLTGPTGALILKIVVGLLSTGGVVKLFELFNFRLVRREKLAHAMNLEAQSQSQIIKNQIEWAEKLEGRIKDLEAVAEQNAKLKKEVAELRGEVTSLRTENKQLKKALKKLSGKK